MPSNNTRNQKNWVRSADYNVQTKWLKEGWLEFRGAAILNKKDEFESLLVLAPVNTPLHDFLTSEEFRVPCMEAVRKTLLIVPDIPEEELEARKVELKKKEVHIKAPASAIEVPPVPVMNMTTRQIEEYLPKMVDSVYEMKKIKPENKWRKIKKDGTIQPPTPALPGWNDSIIDPKKMAGMGKGLGKGASWQIKLQLYHILKFHGLDPETYADEIPSNYVPKCFSIDDLEKVAKAPPPKKVQQGMFIRGK